MMMYQSSRHPTLMCRDGLAMILVPSTLPALKYQYNFSTFMMMFFLYVFLIMFAQYVCFLIIFAQYVCLFNDVFTICMPYNNVCTIWLHTYVFLLCASSRFRQYRHPCIRILKICLIYFCSYFDSQTLHSDYMSYLVSPKSETLHTLKKTLDWFSGSKVLF